MASTAIRLTAVAMVLFIITVQADTKNEDQNLLSTVSNRLIPKLFKHIGGTKEENVVFSSVGLVQNLAVVSILTNHSGVTSDLLHVLGLHEAKQLEELRHELKQVLSKFETEVRTESAFEGENTTEATGLFNYLHVNPEHKLRDELMNRLTNELRTNLTYDTSLEEGTFSVSVDTGVLSAWRERESLVVFTLLQYATEEQFTLHNGSTRTVPLVPHIGMLGTRQHPNFTLVRLPLQAASTHLVLLLPHSSEEFGRLVDAMPDVENLTDSGDHREEITLWIPQMLAISSLELNPTLHKLGGEQLFKADFSAVTKSDEPLVLSGISQKSFFSTSFTSVKSITESEARFGMKRNRREIEKRSITFNKPFLFFIERTDLRLVLTAGCINDPTQFPTQA
ncbi:hypothetical protein B566_EDAN009775 [Ephemera danica]|nr:hypothetical protein B566_EDAN009775 [Ephemera danica]